jgi:hypothetical protein
MSVICVVKFYKKFSKYILKNHFLKNWQNPKLFSKEKKINFTETCSPFKARSKWLYVQYTATLETSLFHTQPVFVYSYNSHNKNDPNSNQHLVS